MTTKQMKGFEDSYVVEGRMALPYTYFAGRVGSKFITTIRDQKKIMGVKCPTCNVVYLPPRQVCDKDFTDIRDKWVDVSNTGVVNNFTVVRYDDKHLPRKAPFVLALIKLEGADTPFMHILEECAIEDVKIGMKVEAVFAKETTNTRINRSAIFLNTCNPPNFFDFYKPRYAFFISGFDSNASLLPDVTIRPLSRTYPL